MQYIEGAHILCLPQKLELMFVSNYCWIKPKYNELRTTSNLKGRTSNSLEPRFIQQNWNLNPSKKPEPNLEKPKVESFWTKVLLPKPKYEPTQTLQTFWTLNPQTLDSTQQYFEQSFLKVACCCEENFSKKRCFYPLRDQIVFHQILVHCAQYEKILTEKI